MPNFFKHTVSNLCRHYKTVLMSVAIIALMTVLVNSLLFTSSLSRAFIATLQTKLSFNVYLKNSTDFFMVRRLMDTLEKRKEVTPPVIYISPEEAKKNLKSALGYGENFLKNYKIDFPAVLSVTLKNPADEKNLRAFLEKSEFKNLVSKQDFGRDSRESKALENVSKNLNRLQALIRSVLVLLVSFSIFTALAAVFITLHLSSHLRRKELFIMKLVGASPKMLEMPFVFEGIFISAAGLIIGTILFLIITPLFLKDPLLIESFENLSMGNIFLLELLIAVLIGACASALMTRSLWFSKKILPFTH